MSKGAITIYGDPNSGNCHKVAFVARRVGVPFRWIDVDITKKETRTPEFLAMNPNGKVPTVVLEDGRVLAESNAIMLFLARDSDLIPVDPYDHALMMQWLFWEQYTHEPAVAVRRYQLHYLKKADDDIDPNLLVKCNGAMTLMDHHLGRNAFFVANRLSLADIALVAYTRFADEAGLILNSWPNVARWVDRVMANLGPLDLQR